MVSHPAHYGYLKIGTTTNPKGRLLTLQTGCPHKRYAYEALVHCPDRRATERRLHATFAAFRTAGTEWFCVSLPSVLSALLDNSSAATVSPLQGPP